MAEPLIAIIDDDESMRLALAGLVRSLRLRAEMHGSAEAFLASTTSSDTQCVITDIQMPGLSGIDLKRQLCAEDRSIPVIMITARLEEKVHDEARASGAFCLLRKPFAASALIACLERALAA